MIKLHFGIIPWQISGDLIYPLSATPKKWSNTFKQFVGNLPTNCLSVFDHFVILALRVKNSDNIFKSLNIVLTSLSCAISCVFTCPCTLPNG